MTEDEAKKKWCPLVRNNPLAPDESYAGVTTRDNKPDYERNCIASACMMWREADRVEDPENYGTYIPTGYCGLAGEPI
jgi:hypothetical protein